MSHPFGVNVSTRSAALKGPGKTDQGNALGKVDQPEFSVLKGPEPLIEWLDIPIGI